MMAQFVAFDPNVEVLGAGVLSYVAAMGKEFLPVLAKHGLPDIKPDGWYPQQYFLDAFRDLAEGGFGATLDLVHVGMKAPENAAWPPEITTIEAALASIDVAYHMNHRGGEIGCYQATTVGNRAVRMFCENPYPCDFDYGLLYATARLYLPSDGTLTVVHDDEAPCRKKGHDSCTYHISW
jgi:hypothetical protein